MDGITRQKPLADLPDLMIFNLGPSKSIEIRGRKEGGLAKS
jgi:hypothetical protein